MLSGPLTERRLSRATCLVAVGTAACLVLVGHEAAAGSGILDKVQTFYERTTDYKASFRQVVKTATPRRTFTRYGTVFFKRPGMMRWDYERPEQVYYVSDGKDLWSYDVEEGVAYRLRVADSDLVQALRFLTAPADLAREFDATEGAPTERGLVPLKLVPKGSERNFRSVTLFVDPATGETRETEVVDPVGNVSHIWFEKPVYEALPAEGFRFTPPEGVRVQDIGR